MFDIYNAFMDGFPTLRGFMMDLLIVMIPIVTVATLFVITQFYWMRHTQKLVNKMMSVNYRDYAISQEREKGLKQAPKVQAFQEPDLGALQEFKYPV